jgi:O-antigen/teichoic acid export membrane protein
MTEQKQGILPSIFSFGSASLFSQICYFGQGLLVIRFVEPKIMGLWTELQLIQTYGMQTHLGLLNGMNRQLPYHAGRGEWDRVENIERAGRAGMSLLALLLGLLLVACTAAFTQVSWGVRIGIMAVGLSTILGLNTEYYLALFRARHQFGRAGACRACSSLLLLAGLPLVYYQTFYGLCWRSLLGALLTAGMCLLLAGRRFAVHIDWQEIRSLVLTGLPIMAVSYGIVLLQSMDRIIIMTFLDREHLGQYALCTAVGGAIAIIPDAVGQVIYPRMVELYGRQGISRSLIRMSAVTSAISFLFAAIAGAAILLFLPWLLRTYVPKYEPVLAAMKVSVFAYVVLALNVGANYFLIATRNKRRQLGVLLASSAVMFAAGWVLSPGGLRGVAFSVLAGFAAYVIGIWILVLLAGSSSHAESSDAIATSFNPATGRIV